MRPYRNTTIAYREPKLNLSSYIYQKIVRNLEFDFTMASRISHKILFLFATLAFFNVIDISLAAQHSLLATPTNFLSNLSVSILKRLSPLLEYPIWHGWPVAGRKPTRRPGPARRRRIRRRKPERRSPLPPETPFFPKRKDIQDSLHKACDSALMMKLP